MASLGRPIAQGGTAGARRQGLRLPAVNWWLVAAIAVFAIGAALPVLQSSATTSRGFDIRAVEQRQAELRGEIATLEAQIAAQSSLERVRQRAEAMGLRPSSEPIVVSVDVPGPEPARIPAEYLPEAVPTPERPDSWWRSLLKWLPLPE
ncbi:Cell division protein FtsL [bacterium HR29]|jgi:hypothetical protein|nr:Cell division protein FtsL [bacterium HR29]